MKVLITGATSMIGRKTADELLQRGHDVQILQRGSSDLNVPVFRGDIRDADAVQKAVNGCDVVIHAAAKVGLVGRFSEFHDINVVGTQHVMNAAVAAGARGVVYVSSPSVSYSTTPVLGAVAPPACDDVLGYYSQTKSVGERAVLADTRIAAVALRPHLVWGPGDTQLVGRIVERARQRRLALVNNGEAIVDSTYIDNVSDALAAAAERVGVQKTLSGRALVVVVARRCSSLHPPHCSRAPWVVQALVVRGGGEDQARGHVRPAKGSGGAIVAAASSRCCSSHPGDGRADKAGCGASISR